MTDYSELPIEYINEAVMNRKGITSIVVLYAERIDLAIDLLQECNGTLWFDHVIQLWEVIIELPGDDDDYIMTNCETPARSICEAWLRWKDWESEQNDDDRTDPDYQIGIIDIDGTEF